MVNQLFRELASLPQIEAIALGGSRAGTHYDENSDYDVYLYCTEPVDENIRKAILTKYCSYTEIGNRFWETEDNCTLKNGIDIDILYRDLDDFCQGLCYVVEQCQPYNAYTTCMWHNLKTCRILFDRNGRLAAAKERFDVPYPDALRSAILDRGWDLLRKKLPAYELQINKAVKRGDLVSVNHRTAAFLETYFDVLFALNRQTHPGEKRMVQFCLERCEVLPKNFEENLTLLFGHLFAQPHAVAADLNRILTELENILE